MKFIAGARHPDGKKNIYIVDDVVDHKDAREAISASVGDKSVVLICVEGTKPTVEVKK